MDTTRHSLSPPSLGELAEVLTSALASNYSTASATVVRCPDLRDAPFSLACEGLNGSESAADIGGQPHLYPWPQLEKQYSLIDCAGLMDMTPDKGSLLGAGAGPIHVHGKPTELAPHLSWEGGFDKIKNLTRCASITTAGNGAAKVGCSVSDRTDCSLMMNLYGCRGLPGPVLKVTAKGRKGDGASFTEFIRRALYQAYGDSRQVSLGGVFIVKKGRARFHIMPELPEELPFKDRSAVDNWLTFHDFDAPMVCLTVFHSADPEQLGLRMEHTHCFSNERDEGGHYHYDLLDADGSSEVEYEAYFNTVRTLFRIDKPISV